MMAEANAAQQGNALKASDNPRESAERLARLPAQPRKDFFFCIDWGIVV